MKWPASVTLVRHGQSEYNVLRFKKQADPLWRQFKTEFDHDPNSGYVRRLAEEVKDRHALGISDYATRLTKEGTRQAKRTGAALSERMPVPDVILVSPYVRTRDTVLSMTDGWLALEQVKTVFEDRIREQEHGLQLLYNDWRVFQALHPKQRALRELMGSYWYQYPQGESVSQVRDRVRDVLGMLIREWAEKHVLIVTHHLTILSFRANLERLSPEQFADLDEKEKPINCGVTMYGGNPHAGRDGRLELQIYNRQLY